jgi:hypothetical protein
MQLDSHLVEKFHSLHRQRQSGVLQASGEGFNLGICLVDGEPVAIDLGEDLEQAFAHSCGTYHKLDDAGLAELSAAISGGAKARDYLVERQLISDAEADQVAQAVVEDALTRTFRGPCTGLEFNQGVTPDSLAIGRSALKMRIGVESLIRTCDQRVGEHQAVEHEVGGWHAVFALTEGEHVSGQLSEYEKMVLNFIDGRATVDEIASLCRDSSMNLGRVLRSLIAKKVIHRIDQHRTSGVRPAVTTPTTRVKSAVKPVPPAEGAPATQPATASAIEMQPYRRAQRESPTGRPIVLVGLIALLAIALGVALLVVQYNRKQETLRKEETEISQLVASRSWRDARAMIDRLRQAAGNDLAAIRTVDTLKAQVESAITAERSRIGDLIEKEEFAAARPRIAALPDDNGLGGRLREAEAEQRATAAALAEEVRGRLVAGDIAGSLSALDEVQGARAQEANAILATWRSDTLVIARSQTHPLQLRLASVARLRQARPDAALEAQLVALDTELQNQVRELAKRLGRLEDQAKAGAWEEVRTEMAALRIGSLGAGTEIEVRGARVAAAADKAERDLEAVQRIALTALSSGAGADGLEDARAKLASALQVYPQASRRESIDRLAATLAACSGIGQRTAAQRAADATALASQVPAGESALAGALAQRAAALQAIEGQARASLDEARRFGRVGDWDAAVKALEAIVRQPNWQFTAVRTEAEQELDAARAKSVKRVQLKEELRAALLRGDLAACENIAREIGLAYLPLVIASTPAGAEVVRADGSVVGVTPLIHDVTADERVDLRLQVRKTGYQQVTVNGAAAEGGWRVAVRLERSVALAINLGHPLTARPAVIDGTLWLADRGQAVAFAQPQAAAQRTIPAGMPLAEPVFAPVAMVGPELLLATREKLALRLGATVERIPLPAATDYAPIAYKSPLVVDRDLLVIAGMDGRLHAVQRGTTALVWQSPGGAAFACAPQLVGESLLVARRDGRLESYRIEDGLAEASMALDQAVLAAWPTASGIGGMTAGRAWTWNGTAAGEDLPEPCLGGGPGVAISALGKVLQRGEKSWVEVGRLEPRPQPGSVITAMLWADQAVVVHDRTLTVCGSSPFRLVSASDLLAPVEWNGSLVAASLDGGLWVWPK